MKRYQRRNKGYMGIAILAVLAVFFALYLILPGVTLWPIGLVSLALVMMVVSHIQGGRHHARNSIQPLSDNYR
nr:hypothetical protein [candidate division Zixibacteria bacterium]